MQIPAVMRYVAAREPGPPRGHGHRRKSGAAATRRRSADRGRVGRRQPPRLHAARRPLSAAARCVADPRTGGRRHASSRWAPATEGWQIGDLVCALTPGGGYAEYCTHAGGVVPADPAGLFGSRGGVAAGELLHRLEQRVRPRACLPRRSAAGPRRHQRHRPHGDPARARRSARRCSPPPAATTRSRSAARSAPTTRSTTGRRTSSPRSRASPASAASTSILDMVGGDYVEKNLKCLALEGRLVHHRVPARAAASNATGARS